MMRKWILMIIISLVLTACSPKKSENQTLLIKSYSSEEYAVIIPYELSDARSWHGKYSSKLDNMVIPKGLKDHAKKYFPVNEYYLSEGILMYDDVLMLQKRESDENPYALNPKSGPFEISDVLTLDSPYIVSDIVDLAFIKDDQSLKLEGLAVAVILNSHIEQGSEQEDFILSDELLYEFGTFIGRRLEQYLRTLPHVGTHLPIYISLYVAEGQSSYVSGRFIGEGFFENRKGQFKKINEKWVIFPSDEALKTDGLIHSNISSMKHAINQFLPENVSFVAKGKYLDHECVYLKIDIDAQAKGYTEIYALAQYVKQLAQVFENSNLDLVINIKSNGEIAFTIKKKINSNKLEMLDIS